MKRFSVCLVIIMVMVTSSLSFTQGINLTGKWKADKEKSDFGMMAQISPDITLTIEHKGNILKINSFLKIEMLDREISTDREYIIDGKQHTYDGTENKGLKYTCKFNDKKIVLDSQVELRTIRDGIEEMSVGESNSVYSLSEDGATLTSESVTSGVLREMTMSLVFNKVK
ncbi:hypothetical protein ACFL4T_08180 [candidate division KSB1 bacterium]